MRSSTEKQPAIGSQGMVVTNHPLGSIAGAEMIAAGGNAIDAAVASLFALTVVEPMMVGIFGAGMTNVLRADGSSWFLNNYATAPAAATPTMYRTLSDTWPDYQKTVNDENDVGALAVGVPGSLAGWCETLDACGTMSLDDVLQPATRYAARGYPASGYLAEIVNAVAPAMARFPETAKTYLPDGSPIRAGHRVVQGDYAETLRALASDGPALLYSGSLGDLAVEHIQSLGGIITREDLTGYHTFPGDVVRGTYRGHEILGPPPPSAGGVILIEMLNLLEGFDLASFGAGSSDAVHLIAEVLRIGFEHRKAFIGDPRFVDVPADRLISKAYADARRTEIDRDRARPMTNYRAAESPHTTHLCAADADGNIVASTQTIHSPFGSKVTVPGTGMLLNNTMNIFDPHPGLANSIEPGKRMTSSMAPVIVRRDGAPYFTVGLPGATKIFPSVMQAILNVIDFGMSPQAAVEAPRAWTQGQELALEGGFDDAVKAELARRGHTIADVKLNGGGMGMIGFDAGRLTGASCWRADGSPVAIGGGMARIGSRFDVR